MKFLNAPVLLPVYLLRFLSLINKYTQIFFIDLPTDSDNSHNSPVIFFNLLLMKVIFYTQFNFSWSSLLFSQLSICDAREKTNVSVSKGSNSEHMKKGDNFTFYQGKPLD